MTVLHSSVVRSRETLVDFLGMMKVTKPVCLVSNFGAVFPVEKAELSAGRVVITGFGVDHPSSDALTVEELIAQLNDLDTGGNCILAQPDPSDAYPEAFLAHVLDRAVETTSRIELRWNSSDD